MGVALLDAAEESLEDTDGAVAESQLHASHSLEGDAVVREGGAVVAHRDHHVTLHVRWSFQTRPFVRSLTIKGSTVYARFIFLLFSTQCTRQTVVCTRESLETDTRYGAARKRRRVNGRGPALTVSPALYVESAASS